LLAILFKNKKNLRQNIIFKFYFSYFGEISPREKTLVPVSPGVLFVANIKRFSLKVYLNQK